MPVNYCPGCGEKKDADDHFCGNCGFNLTKCDEKLMKYCPHCGKERKANARFCIQCGLDFFSFRQDSMSDSKPRTENSEHKTGQKTESKQTQERVWKPEKTAGNTEISSMGILKVVSVLAAILFAYFGLKSMVYFNYSSMQAKIWAFLSVATGLFNTMLMLLIAFRCHKEYGRSLLYAFVGSEIIRIGLKLYYIQDKAIYHDVKMTEYLPILWAVLLVLVLNYLMKQQNLLYTAQEEGFKDTVCRIPYAIQKAFNPNAIEKQSVSQKTANGKHKFDNVIQMPGFEYTNNQEKALMWIPTTKIYLIFCILFTANLIIGVFSKFSLWGLIGKIIPIIMCVGLWKIYGNKREYEKGTGLISGTLMVRFVFHIVICVILLIIVFSLQLGFWWYLGSIALVCIDLGYLYSLHNTFLRLTQLGKGENVEVTAGLYPIFALVLGAIVKVISFIWALWLQSVANGLNSRISGYGNAASSEVANFFSMLGLNYSYVYGESSSFIRGLLQPIMDWIQSILGFSQNPFIMLIAIAIPVCEIILLNNIRYTHNAPRS